MDQVINFVGESEILQCISDLTKVSSEEISLFLSGLEVFEKGDCPHVNYWNAFMCAFEVKPKIAGTIYFHGCRCLPSTDFSLGLLPNHQAIDLIWRQIWEICGDAVDFRSLRAMREEYESSSQSKMPGGYFARLEGRKRERGPWGKLVRDEWFFKASNSNHYLNNGSELISLILKYFSKEMNLRELYRERTQACIVHFLTNESDPQNIGHGISYLRDRRFCKQEHEYQNFYGLESLEGVGAEPLKVEWIDLRG